MKKFLAALILLLAPGLAQAATWFSCNGQTYCGGSESEFHGTVEYNYADSTAPDGDGRVWRFTYPENIVGGNAIGNIWTNKPTGSTEREFWIEYYFKYSSNHTFQGTMDKQFYFHPGNTMGAGINIRSSGNRNVSCMPQDPAALKGQNVQPDLNIYPVNGVWAKYTGYFKINTGAAYNGIYKAWVNDVLVSSYTDVKFSDNDGLDNGEYVNPSSLAFVVIWGGSSGTKPETSYLYIDKVYIGSTQPGGDGEDISPPYVSNRSPAPNATGVPTSSTTIAVTLNDSGGGIDDNTIAMTVNGTLYGCDNGVTCAGSYGAAENNIFRTNLSDWDYGQVVNVSLNASDVAGNSMPTVSWSFTVEYDTSPTTAKTKAELLAYITGLKNNVNKKLLSGQRIESIGNYSAGDDSEVTEISALTGGILPAIMGLDFSCSPDLATCNYDAGIVKAKAHWNAGGMVHFTWHSANPANNNEWNWPLQDPYFTPFTNVYTPGNSTYDNFRAQMVKVGDAIQSLEDDNVVISFAPFHETNNHNATTSFWWDGRDAGQFVALWQYLRNYLEVERGLSNIIWVFAQTRFYSVTEYYPGDNNVDILGLDIYAVDGRFDGNDSAYSWGNYLEEYTTLVSTYPDKPFVFSELGQCLTPGGVYSPRTDAMCSGRDARYIVNDISTYFPNAVWWMNWDDGDLDYGLGNQLYVQELMEDSRVVTLQDNPSGKIAVSNVEIITTTIPTSTVGVSGYFDLQVTGGQSPFTWDNTTVLPSGWSISSGGRLSWLPTASGTPSFTVRVTDALDNTDTQEYTVTILSDTPGGQVTVELPVTLTYIRSAAPTTNYSSVDNVTAYTYPAYFPANRIIGTVNISSIPALSDVTASTLTLNQVGFEGFGGALMRLHAHRITSDPLPDVATITWNTFDNVISGPLSYVDCDAYNEPRDWNVLEAILAAKAAGASTLALLVDGRTDNAQDENRIFDDAGTLSITYTQLKGPGGPSIGGPGKHRLGGFSRPYRMK